MQNDEENRPPLSQDVLPAPGGYRFFGLAAFIIGLSVYDQWGISSYRDWYPSRFAFLCAIFGAVVYFEGLAAKIVAARQRPTR